MIKRISFGVSWVFFISFSATFPYVWAENISEIKNDIIKINLRLDFDGVYKVDESFEGLKNLFGEKNVEEFTYVAEGDPQIGYEVKFKNGHYARFNGAAFEITSESFRTQENLGVGSTWAEFKKAYADGQLEWDPISNTIWSEQFKFHLRFDGDKNPSLNDPVTAIYVNIRAFSLD